jgi:glycosyltransferase involved in cell wall biosynthesis
MKVNISAVIITLNEEKNIERCLLSAKEVADDIVVVDSFSKDRTEEICLKHNVRFIRHEFTGHIEQKNWAITQAKYPYILSLDADEVLSETLKKSILAVKENWQADGYYFNRLTNYCGKWVRHCGWYPDRKFRLWDSRKGGWKGVNPHDCYKMKPGAIIQFLKGDILHYSYYSIREHIEQVNKFTEIAAQENFKSGKKFNFFQLLFNPVWKFKRDYIFKGGFLDGYYGFVICFISAGATFLKYVKLRELWKEEK